MSNAVIIAASGWGKTYLASKYPGIFIDADAIVPWPSRPSWWSGSHFAKEISDPFETIRSLEELDTGDRIILYAPSLDAYDMLERSNLRLFYSTISSTKLARNLKTRSLDAVENQENDYDKVSPLHHFLEAWSQHHRLTRIDKDYLMNSPQTELEHFRSITYGE